MRYLLSILAALLLSMPLYGQQSPNINYLHFAGAPSGSCNTIMVAEDDTTGFLYTCLGGSWFLAGGGGSSGANTSLSNLNSPTAINLSTLTFAGAAGLTALGTNQNITLTPSGTFGTLIAPTSVPSSAYTFSVDGSGNITAKPNNPALAVCSGTDFRLVADCAFAAVGPNGATFYFKNGIYNVNTLNTTQTPVGAAVFIPGQISPATQGAKWRFIGEASPNWTGEISGAAYQTTGVVINITAAALVGAPTFVEGFFQQSSTTSYPMIEDEFRNIAVRFPTNRGNEVGFNASNASTVIWDNTLVDRAINYTSMTAPASGTFGYYTPPGGRGNVITLRNTYAVNMQYGYFLQAEHVDADAITAIYCTYFGKVTGDFHNVLIRNAMDQENNNGLTITGSHTGVLLDIIGYDIEQATSGTWARSTQLSESPDGTFNGYISYDIVTQSVGLQPCVASIFSSGGSNFIQECGGHLSTPLVNPSGAVTTLAGTTAGNLFWSQPMQGSAYKKSVLNFQGFENTSATPQTVTFPTAFTYAPAVSGCTLPSGVTVSTTAMSAASMGGTFTAQCIVEGQ